jgi:hypothetical protein
MVVFVSSRRTKIFFDQTQNERGRLDSTFSHLGDLLRDNDFDVEPYTEFMILAKKIEKAQVIVFGCPNSSKLRPAEIDVLKRYVEKGGGLLLLSLSGGDRGLMNNLSKLAENFGISFDNTAVKDERNNAGIPTMPVISDITAHPVTEDVKNLVYPSGCTLKVTGKAVELAKTSEMAEPAQQPIIAVAEHRKGRVVSVGSYEIFRTGGGFDNAGNKAFALNVFRWLGGEVRFASPSKVAKGEKGTASETETTVDAPSVSPAVYQEMEKTLRRLVNAVFDLQKDVGRVREQVKSVDGNMGKLRDQFQDFAEKTQKQLGMIVPTKQFETKEESRIAELENDIKAIEKEISSVQQLRDHVEERHSSGAMPTETYNEQAEKLDKRIKSLEDRATKKKKELEKITAT